MEVTSDPIPPKSFVFQATLPPALEMLLANCPKSGSGERQVHRWLLETANLLRHFVLADTAADLLSRGISRPPERNEIPEAVAKAYGQPAQADDYSRSHWPQANPKIIHAIVSDAIAANDTAEPELVRLRLRSKPIPSPRDILKTLFPGDPFVCCGLDAANAACAPLSKFKFLSRFQFIVPNPMTAAFATDPVTGRRMERCLANVAERRYIVTDFDLKGDWIGPYQQCWLRARHTLQDVMAALISFLAGPPSNARLVLVVFSGNQSLQAWFGCAGIDPLKLAAWFSDCCLIGADPAGWVSCQYFRMPGSMRKAPANLQEVVYFDPNAAEPPSII
jgi:hypothetical protein